MKTARITTEQINSALPQTQCKLCTYAGCKPYARAIAENGDRIDRCLPGGVSTLKALAALTDQDVTPLIEDFERRAKPRQIVVIREEECIGCTKCIQACPVDAILGAAKQMHTVMTDECTGCELCIEPCPVDCIDLVTLAENTPISTKEAAHFQMRYEAREMRLARIQSLNKQKHEQAKKGKIATKIDDRASRQQLIQEAVARAKMKKQNQ